MPKLTEKYIAAFLPAPGAKDRLAFDTECRGLGVRATAGGSKSFVVQWTDPATGRKVREPLGAWGALTLDKAREAARIRLGRVAAGFDPRAEREAKKAEERRQREAAEAAKREAAFTLEVLINEWERLHLSTRKPRYAAEAIRTLQKAFPNHMNRPASHLSYADALAAVDARIAAGTPVAARALLDVGRACFGWAVQRRKLTVNPFAGLPRITGGAPQRDRVLSDEELGEVWRAAATLPSPHGQMVRFLMLTLARREEVGAMRWNEVSDDLSTWRQPGARTKNGRAHVVDLSMPARTVLQEMLGAPGEHAPTSLRRSDLLVFGVAGNRAITAHSWMKKTMNSAIATERRKAGQEDPVGDWRFHDFRRTGVTWLAGAGFPPHVADRLLNHVSGAISGVAAIYQRNEFLPERKTALDAWGAHVMACAAAYPSRLPKIEGATSQDLQRAEAEFGS